jgi:hypothetical protein
MNEDSGASTKRPSTIPPDDLQRNMAVARPNEDQHLRHIGLVGDTYTILLTGEDTAGRYCLIDMHVPPGGALLPIGMISRNRSPCLPASWKPPFAE